MLKISLLFKKNSDLRVNNLRILTIKIVKLSEYYFHINLNILGDFQICNNVPLTTRNVLRTQTNIYDGAFNRCLCFQKSSIVDV